MDHIISNTTFTQFDLLKNDSSDFTIDMANSYM